MLDTSSRYNGTSNSSTAVDLSHRSSNSLEDAPLDLKIRSHSSFSCPSSSSPTSFSKKPLDSFISSRDSSVERDHEFSHHCHYCGADSTLDSFRSSQHGEDLCQRGSLTCSYCAKTFTQWIHLESHRKCHQKTKQRQYPCITCGKVFTSASNRNMHQRIHKGVRPFQCSPCGVFFRQKAHLQKHERTQGHVQASEIFKVKMDSYSSSSVLQEPSIEEDDIECEHSEEDENDNKTSESCEQNSSFLLSVQPLVQTSPKRKQLKPRKTCEESSPSSPPSFSQCSDSESKGRGGEINDEERKLKGAIDYNEQSHGYECVHCAYESHELSSVKTHVKVEHLSQTPQPLESFQCFQCFLFFKKDFHLALHSKTHESETLSCDHCNCLFRKPNKLIGHMEDFHYMCFICGDLQRNRESLLIHRDETHGSSGPLFFTSTPLSGKAEERAAKMRKVDILAETIRQKQLANAYHGKVFHDKNIQSNTSSSSVRRTNDMSAIRALLSKEPVPSIDLNALVSHLASKVLLHSERQSLSLTNNNVMIESKDSERSKRGTSYSSSTSSPPLPPLSSSSSLPHQSSLSSSSREPKDSVGLDLTTKKKESESDYIYTSSLIGPRPPFPFPFFGSGPHSLAKHLLSLAHLSPSPPSSSSSSSSSSLSKYSVSVASRGVSSSTSLDSSSPSSTNSSSLTPLPYTMLSAMLSHSPFPSVFPGMSSSASLLSSETSSSSLQDASQSQAESSSSDIKPFHCTFCRKDFSHLSSLESHMEHMHSGESKHACETCGKSFSSKSNLTAHKKIHSGERPFECGICHKRFRQKAHLQKHETTHSSATPYKCSVCDKAFGHPSNLNTHMATHSTVRPYHCSDCGKSYKDSASFKRHRLGHTGERPYICSFCSESFIDSKSLRRHSELHHPGNPLDSLGEDDEEEEYENNEEEDEAIDVSENSALSDSLLNSSKPCLSSSAYSSFESSSSEDSIEKQQNQNIQIQQQQQNIQIQQQQQQHK